MQKLGQKPNRFITVYHFTTDLFHYSSFYLLLDNRELSRTRRDSLEENNNVGTRNSSPPRKRQRRYVTPVNSQARLENQRARQSGRAYTTLTGNAIRERTRRPLDKCRMNCAERVSDEKCQELFETYWRLGNTTQKRQFIAPLIDVVPKKTSRETLVSPHRQKNRQTSLKYSVPIDSQLTKVCKGCFLRIFDRSNMYIDIIARKKLKNPTGFRVADERGRHPPPQKKNEQEIAIVRKHILSFPAYESHYARQKTSKKYLPSDLTLATMFTLFGKKYPEMKVSRWTYEREFHKLGLSFKEPKSDTCKTCDELQMKLTAATTEEGKALASSQIADHHRKANAAYSEKNEDKEKSKNSGGKMVVATFDLQQCLPTPSIPTGQIFYSRQLWTYNLTVHNCTTGRSINHMWHEAIAARGANEIGSAVYDFVLSLPDTVEHLVLYSDSCPGQNKNSIISAMFMSALQKKKSIKIIDHKFLHPGHTRNECDSDHAIIERAKKRTSHIYLPRDHHNLVRNAGKQFDTVVMDAGKQ